MATTITLYNEYKSRGKGADLYRTKRNVIPPRGESSRLRCTAGGYNMGAESGLSCHRNVVESGLSRHRNVVESEQFHNI